MGRKPFFATAVLWVMLFTTPLTCHAQESTGTTEVTVMRTAEENRVEQIVDLGRASSGPLAKTGDDGLWVPLFVGAVLITGTGFELRRFT